MIGTDATLRAPSGDAFAALVARLRLTQREMRSLLALGGDAAFVLPDLEQDVPRTAAVAAALEEALQLVADDRLVARWLRTPHARRGGATPLQEVEIVEGDRLIRFILRPHPTELVRLVADAEKAGVRKAARAERVGRPAHA